MKTIKTLVLALFTAFLVSVAPAAAKSKASEELRLWMTVSPNPVVGKPTTVSITSSGGGWGSHQYTWNSSSPAETPQLYSWTGTGEYPYSNTKVVTFVFTSTGNKSITVSASIGNKQVVRTISFDVAARCTRPTIGQTWVAVSPPNPMIGEKVTVSVKSTCDNKSASTKTTCFTYTTSGTKSVKVASGNGTFTSISFDVVEGRITLLTPNGGQVWEPGKTYVICWYTEGNVPFVQIGLWDDRYNSEVGNSGEVLIAAQTANTGSFLYTVPMPSPDGISAGNLGGRNYKVSVQGWNPCFGGMSADYFTIKMPVESPLCL